MRQPKSSGGKKIAKARHAQHALVGGWSQRRGDFVGLLLGVRQGRQRRLTYIGEVRTDPDGLETNLLEPRLREIEVETSPFIDPPPAQRDRTHHWIDPDLVAEIAFESWARDGTIDGASLRAVTSRSSFRRANWVALPK